ncbi:hypothetical protein BASA81_005382 [Batrachochytrium salamandrivorans]|nr:hypothetical protein BASA81_005382 [Batrachochytrium salamandrivorans]
MGSTTSNCVPSWLQCATSCGALSLICFQCGKKSQLLYLLITGIQTRGIWVIGQSGSDSVQQRCEGGVKSDQSGSQRPALIFEAAKAHHYGPFRSLAIQAVTSVPAERMDKVTELDNVAPRL